MVSSLLSPLLAPGVALLQRGRLSVKLAVLSAAALGPLASLWLWPQADAVAVVGALGYVYLVLCLHRTTTDAMRAVGRGIEVLADGNLARAVTVPGGDEFAAMGQALERMATALSSMVAAVRNDASLVERAEALVARVGWAQAQTELHAQGNPFSDRDLYVFAFDRQGIYRAFSSNPAKIGQPLASVPGLDAPKLVRDAWSTVDGGRSGWVDYDIVNPTNGAVTPKTSYVAGVGPELLIGCGVYRNVTRAPAPAAPRPATAAPTFVCVAVART